MSFGNFGCYRLGFWSLLDFVNFLDALLALPKNSQTTAVTFEVDYFPCLEGHLV
jgi:hypothetical protein